MVFGLVNLRTFKHLLVSVYWQSWWWFGWGRRPSSQVDLSSHTSLEEDDDDEVFHVYMAVVDTFIILWREETSFLGWPLSKENNGSSNVQLTVSISVLYPVIMPSKVCSLLIWAFLLLWVYGWLKSKACNFDDIIFNWFGLRSIWIIKDFLSNQSVSYKIC